MSPDDAIASLVVQLDTARLWATVGWFVAFGLAVLVKYTGDRSDRGCPSCSHCVDRIKREEAEARERTEAYARRYRIGSIWEDEQAERERLFGRQVVDEAPEEAVAHDEGPLGGQDGGEGHEPPEGPG